MNSATTTGPITFVPGQIAYFRTRAINTSTTYPPGFTGPVGLTVNDSQLTSLVITGTGGSTFYMLADRAGFVDDYDEPQTFYGTPPDAPFTGYNSLGYRGVTWKIPPYMPAGKYLVRLYTFRYGSSSPQMFTATGATIAEGSLVVAAGPVLSANTLVYNLPLPTASNPVFKLTWPKAEFPSSASLRVMVRNTKTNEYYALSPGYDDLGSSAPFYPSWEANVAYNNTGSATVRYNSTTLYGGLNPPFTGPTTSANTPTAVSAGYYEVYVDDKNSASTMANKYLTLSGTPTAVIPLL